ncbi:cytochrome b/b6 domain-containing protein [Pigmentiphaga sp.]|jgi:Cytochrome b|uniref:cytochrome b/b6 domain-containing protein n=1 Tax=Pigmentiphaga sp. TaxID=1977564 RepID=UPI0025F16B13|nr:cytochrome b/b6 domain-containing protein [Pigmentiphaga sp.]MBX6320043.1 cytochrome b/b6 domain-containing protein [Pigmentiphaga sp.]
MSTPSKIRVWDLPVRIFHWLLVACVVGAYVTIKAGGLWTEYHMLFGYAVLGLILFRIVWGFVGSQHARFSSFLRGPCAVLAYLKGTTPRRPGHNPLGAWSVLAMILLLGYQAVTGLFANDDIFTEGPLASLVDKAWSDRLTGLHKLNEWIILALVALHVAAILWYRVAKKQKLTRAMITGDAPASEFAPGADSTRDTTGTRLLALAIAAIVAAVVYGIVSMRPAGF